MKKLLLFVAAAAATMTAMADTVLEMKYGELAVANVAYGSGETLVRNTTAKTKVNGTDMYPFTAGTFLAENDVMISRGDGLLRFADVRNIGLFNNNKNFYGIGGLQAGDVVTIAYNGGGNSDGTMKEVPALTDLYNATSVAVNEPYVLEFEYNSSARTLSYDVYALTVTADGAIAFALQTAYIAYLKVEREASDPGENPGENPGQNDEQSTAALDWNFAQFAATQIGTLGGSNITPVFGAQVSMMNTNVYSISVAGLLGADSLFVNRNADMLVRYSDSRSIGLYSKSTPTFVIPGLQQNDTIEIAWNAGGKSSESTYYTIDSTLTALANVEEVGDWGEYEFSHTSDGTARTITYSTRRMLVQAAGDVRFAIPSVKGDGSNWKIYIAYIRVLRGENGPTTAIDSLGGEKRAVKRVENGQIVIYKDGVRYNLLGGRL